VTCRFTISVLLEEGLAFYSGKAMEYFPSPTGLERGRHCGVTGTKWHLAPLFWIKFRKKKPTEHKEYARSISIYCINKNKIIDNKIKLENFNIVLICLKISSYFYIKII
jgi:hypothetical protein